MDKARAYKKIKKSKTIKQGVFVYLPWNANLELATNIFVYNKWKPVCSHVKGDAKAISETQKLREIQQLWGTVLNSLSNKSLLEL